MTVSNLAGVAPSASSRRERAKVYRTTSEALLDDILECRRLVERSFEPATLAGYWHGEERARITIRSLGRFLAIDLPVILEQIQTGLDEAETHSLNTFAEQVAPGLFASIDEIRPDEVHLGDGRDAVERLHYAWSLRAALLQHTLAVVNHCFSAPHFEDLASAVAWISAYSSVLQEAETILDETQALLRDEALAVQNYLDGIRSRLKRVERDARADGVLLKRDWRHLLQNAEDEIIARLAEASEEIERVTFETLTEAQAGGWLESLALYTHRYLPKLGLLLLTVAGASAAGRMVRDLPPGALATPALPQPVRGEAAPGDAERYAALQRGQLGVVPRQSVSQSSAPAAAEPAGRNAIAAFFEALPSSRGRQTLHIKNSADLEETLRQLERFGYPRDEVLALLGLRSPEALTGGLRLDLRASAAGRPLLFPLNPETAGGQNVSPAAATGESLDEERTTILTSIARAFGIALDALLQANPAVRQPNNRTIGDAIRIPGAAWTAAARGEPQPLIRWGDRLETIAARVGVPVVELARLNNVEHPESWIYDGQPLWLPSELLQPGMASTLAAGSNGSPQDTTAQTVATAPLAAGEAFYVYRPAGETLLEVAARFDTTVAQLLADNPHLADGELEAGEAVLVRSSLDTVRESPEAGSRPAVTLRASLASETIVSGGSLDSQARIIGETTSHIPAPSTASVTRPDPDASPSRADGAALAAKYGGQTWESLEAMPEEVRAYFVSTIEAVADFFDVRPGDIAGILRAEQDNTGWTLQEPGVSSAGATGVAQVVARTWNGWSNPHTSSHSRSLAEIERYGGLGFDWSARAQWQAWKQGRLPLSALEQTDADPTVFENGVAAIARHLARWGLTRDAFARDPQAARTRLADAIAVYNSGKPLSVSRNFTQSAANRKTVGQYVEEVIATAEGWPTRSTEPRLAATAGGRTEAAGSTTETRATEAPTLAATAEGRVEGEEPQQSTEAAPLQPATVAHAELEAQPQEPPAVALSATSAGGEPLAVVLTAPTNGNGASGNGHARVAPASKTTSGLAFSSTPLDPMPQVVKPFGAPVNYQAGGRHTGIDVAGPDGATLYAVADATVTYVGPLFCDQPRACRGDNAVVLDLGNNVYAIYSHNSAALVEPGDQVSAGQPVARQGNEGYSFGSHLHFEVHVGAPWSGDWRKPFNGGEFVDPMPYFPDS